MTEHNWRKKSDDELIKMINASDFAKITNDMRLAARSELHRRQTNKDKCMLYMTALILVLTIALVYAEFFHKSPPAPMTVPAEKVQSQQLNPTEKKKTPQRKNDVQQVITHRPTSTKQK